MIPEGTIQFMAIAAAAAISSTAAVAGAGKGRQQEEEEVLMPGFRFHPTEEELVEFYLRRKVEGKRFNVELVTFLDLYRYDPWELPALAAIGEKEWFFYVPRDRKYRNGDRPNRVTTSGYWKATGADRTVRAVETGQSIGLKKTLVFYSGKAPRGIRTAWIMNEYRLPPLPRGNNNNYHHTTTTKDHLRSSTFHHKAEMALCRVYKRAGVEDHCQFRGTSRPSSSSRGTTTPHKKHNTTHQPAASFQSLITAENSSSSEMAENYMHQLAGGGNTSRGVVANYGATTTAAISNNNPLSSTASTEEDVITLAQQYYPKNTSNALSIPACTLLTSSSSSPVPTAAAAVDELNKLVGCYNNYQCYITESNHQLLLPATSQSQLLPLIPSLSTSLAAYPDNKPWEWNLIPDAAGRDFAGF